MLYPEPLSCLLSAIILLVIPAVFRSTGRRRWRLAVCLGVLLGLELLTKVSGLAIALPVAAFACCELVVARGRTVHQRILDFAPWCAALGLCAAIAAWYYVRNVLHYHDAFITVFELHWKGVVASSSKVPYLDRRTLGFVFGWDTDIYKFPYYPSAAKESHRFFPIVLASTFGDYYNYSFSGLPWNLPSHIYGQGRPLTESLVVLSQGCMAGGTVICVATLVAGLFVARREFRSPNWGTCCLLGVPVVMTLLGLHYAIKYPHDDFGVIKGTYLQFGAPPLYALFGIAVDWSMRRKRTFAVAGVLFLSLALVAAYTVCCRTGLLLMWGHTA
jgi:hypothetical protein